MKKRLYLGLVATAIAGTAAMPFSAAKAEPAGARFACLSRQGVPATVALTKRGPVPVINWRTTLGGTYTPQVRCNIISKRFQKFYESGTLNFLTTGRKNRLPIICVANYKGGACAHDLFTLKPGSNPGHTLRNLMAVRVGAAGPLNESGARTYIDVKELLETAPVDTSIVVPEETAIEPTLPVQPAPATQPTPSVPEATETEGPTETTVTPEVPPVQPGTPSETPGSLW